MTFLFKGQPYDLTNDHELTSFLDQLVIIYDQSSTPEAKNVLFQDLTLAEATVLPPLPYPKIIQLGHIAGLRVLLNLKKMHHTHFRARLNSALFNYYGSVSLLHCAASFGHCDIIEALIKDYGYNPFIEGYNFDSLDYSNSLLKTAEEGGHAEAIALISNTEQLIKLRNAYLNNNPLEEETFEFDLTDFNNTRLYASVLTEFNSIRLYELSQRQLNIFFSKLLFLYQDPTHKIALVCYLRNSSHSKLQEVLHYATRYGYKDVVAMLLDVGFRPLVLDKKKQTIFNIAAITGNTDMIEFLFSRPGLVELAFPPGVETKEEPLEPIARRLTEFKNPQATQEEIDKNLSMIRGFYHQGMIKAQLPFLNLSYFPDISSKDIIHIICAYCTLEDLEFFSNFFVLQMKAVWALESVWSDRHQLAPSQVRGLIEDKTITTPGKTPKATNQTINIRPALEILAGTNTNDFGQIIPILRELEQVFAPRFIYFDKQTDDLQEIFDYATLLRPIGCVHLYILSQSLNLYYIDFEKGSREKIDVLDISKKLLASIARTAKGPTDIDVYMFKTITRGLHNPGFFETKLLEYGYDINSLVDTNLDRYRSIPFKTWLIILADIAAIILQVLTLALSIYACFFIAGEPIALGLCVSAMIVQLCLIFTSAVQLLDNVLTLKCLLSPLSSNFSDFTALDKLGIIHHRTSRVHELHEAAVTSAKASCITILWQFLASFVGLLDVSDITTLSYIGIALATVAGVSLVGRLLQVGFFVYDKRKNTPEPEPAIEDTDAFRQLQIQFKSPCGEENIPEQQSLGLT